MTHTICVLISQAVTMSLAHLKYHLETPAERSLAILMEFAVNLSNCVNKSCFFAALHDQAVFTPATNQDLSIHLLLSPNIMNHKYIYSFHHYLLKLQQKTETHSLSRRKCLFPHLFFLSSIFILHFKGISP